jgi:hypothetical protein
MSDDLKLELLAQLEPIPVQSYIKHENLITLICNAFTSSVPLVVHVTAQTRQAWLYFNSNKLTACYTEEQIGMKALLETFKWHSLVVLERRWATSPDIHFDIDQKQIIELFNEQLPEIELNKKVLPPTILPPYLGCLILRKGKIVYLENLNPMSVPFEYLVSIFELSDLDSTTVSTVQNQDKRFYYSTMFDNDFIICTLPSFNCGADHHA